MRASKRSQLGYFHAPSDGEFLGCFAVVAAFFIAIGVGLAVFLPMLWEWLKPILRGWLA